MKHPSDEDLQMWADGELESGADALEAHVAACARCAAVVASVRSLGGGLRLWSDSLELRSVSLVDAIEASVTPDIGARGVSAPPSAEPTKKPELRALPGGRAEPSSVRPVSRRAWVWPALAAAAAVLFVLGPRVSPRTTTSTHIDHPIAARPETLAAPTEPGADVVRIDVEGAKSYTVMQVPGTIEGSTTAVVWIQDEPEDTEGSTQ